MLITSDVLTTKYQDQIAKNIKILLDRHYLTPSEFAKKLGVSSSTASRMINPRQNLTFEILAKIAKFFNISIGQLIGDLPLTLNKQPIYTSTVPTVAFKDAQNFLSKVSDRLSYSAETFIVSSKHKITEHAFGILSDAELEPTFQVGTVMLFDSLIEDLTEYNNRYLIISGVNAILSLKKLIIDEGICYLKSINIGLPPTKLTNNQSVLGVMIQYHKEF